MKTSAYDFVTRFTVDLEKHMMPKSDFTDLAAYRASSYKNIVNIFIIS